MKRCKETLHPTVTLKAVLTERVGTIWKKMVWKDRAKSYRELKQQIKENKKLKAKLEKYKKRFQRERLKTTNLTSPSYSKKVRHEKVSLHKKNFVVGTNMSLKSSRNRQ
ncbi:hypothetical protein J6590_057908 [Homalodisca vitripennis]|nr:hypothetical protein J6590_057908 [Homalodisca vitripennis]